LLFAVPRATAPAQQRALFGAALYDFRAAVIRHNLWELACSDVLFAHYQLLRSFVSPEPKGPSPITLDELALAGRPIPPAALSAKLSDTKFFQCRARYERALLGVLRSTDQERALTELDTLETCFAALTGPDAYDFWRLATAVLKALRNGGRACQPDALRLYARFNLVLAEQQTRSALVAPVATVRCAVALLWREFALHGSSQDDCGYIELLRDYGLSINQQSADGGTAGSLWDSDTSAGDVGTSGDAAAMPKYVQQQSMPIPRQSLRGIGALRVHVLVYEDFLQTADAAIAALTIQTAASPHEANRPDASAALQAADAAYRLGAAACAAGLGSIAILADALGLAWRRLAHAAAGSATAVTTTNSHALQDGAEALRRLLHQVAAGVAPANPAASLADLTTLIESDRWGSPVP